MTSDYVKVFSRLAFAVFSQTLLTHFSSSLLPRINLIFNLSFLIFLSVIQTASNPQALVS